MKSEPEAIAGTHTDPLKPPPKRVEGGQRDGAV